MRSHEKLQALRTIWGRPSMAYLAVFLCAIYETALLTRLLLAPGSANPRLGFVMASSSWGTAVFVLAVIGAVALLCLRRRWPEGTLLAVSALMLVLAAIYGSAYTYLLLVWMVCVYAAVVGSRRPGWLILALLTAAVAALGSVFCASVWHHDSGLTALLYPSAFCCIVSLGLGFVARTRREKRTTELALEQERDRSLRLAEQRNEAIRQSRIAGQLHDSVGHDLTAIIALSEGLDKATGRPEIDEAIAMINDLSRQGLADTRTAVKALQPAADADSSSQASEGQLHGWDDIDPILDHARQIGMTVALTETGSRPPDPSQADLSFTVTREAVTNAIRHGQGVDRIVVSWDHDAQGGIAITVRDNGQQAGELSAEGTGLGRLKESVEGYGGSCSAGPSSSGWTLRAVLPSLAGNSAIKEPA